jgi:lysine-specific demethylase 3
MGRRDWFLVMTIPPHCSGSHLLKIFEQEWSNQRPILLRNVLSRLDRSLWTPEWFKNGTLSNQIVDLIDCREHIPVQGMTMKMFFDGFDKVDDTTVDAQTLNENENGLRPILKVKDWPPSADFQFILPDHFKDLEHKIPMSKFTDREGALNMAHHLPAHFSKPDLGPKMYIAYSSVDTPKAATTNLHMDISDAVNVLTYVAPVKTPEFKAKIRHILSEELKCGKEQLDRLDKETPGAIWHLYRPEDSNKLRSFIAKVRHFA